MGVCTKPYFCLCACLSVYVCVCLCLPVSLGVRIQRISLSECIIFNLISRQLVSESGLLSPFSGSCLLGYHHSMAVRIDQRGPNCRSPSSGPLKWTRVNHEELKKIGIMKGVTEALLHLGPTTATGPCHIQTFNYRLNWRTKEIL